ncbi:hypothetical protein PUN4_530086 [Paraburkholderia unamae]|nr:hypothetical protein PUN4_530086 [Paraburkholderia unamae]
MVRAALDPGAISYNSMFYTPDHDTNGSGTSQRDRSPFGGPARARRRATGVSLTTT